MNDFFIILAGILGLDINSEVDSKFIAYCTKDIGDVGAFIDYCNDKKDTIQFVRKNERLNILATKFKKLEEEAAPSEVKCSSLTYAGKLAALVKQCRTFVEDNDIDWHNVADKDGLVFEEHQVRALHYIGTVRYVIELSRLNELEDAIAEAYMAKKKKQASYEMLTAGQKKLKELTGKVRVE